MTGATGHKPGQSGSSGVKPDQPGRCDTPDLHKRVLDVRGLRCPLPVLKTRRKIGELAQGQVLVVLATDPLSVIDFRHFCDTMGHELLEWSEHDGCFTFKIRRALSQESDALR